MSYNDFFFFPQTKKNHIFSLALSERRISELGKKYIKTFILFFLSKIHENFYITEGLKTNKLVKKMERKSQMQDTRGLF